MKSISLNGSVDNPRVNEKVNVKVSVKVSENQSKILDAIRQNPSITQEALSKLVGISAVHINKNMKFLQDNNFITRTGSDKKGLWLVNEDISTG